MSRWLDLAAQMEAGEEPGAISVNSATSPPIGPNDTIGTTLPPALLAGLERLRGRPAPNIARPELWPSIVADALRLASDGHAGKALALGWEPLQLFGCSPQVGGEWELEGLAVKLCGRRPSIYKTHAILESNAATHSVFIRRPTAGAVMLWELG